VAAKIFRPSAPDAEPSPESPRVHLQAPGGRWPPFLADRAYERVDRTMLDPQNRRTGIRYRGPEQEVPRRRMIGQGLRARAVQYGLSLLINALTGNSGG
jgi:hypothetical protein